MSDLTPLFTQCVTICKEGLPQVKTPSVVRNKYIVKDKFNQESQNIYHNLSVLSQYLNENKSVYLSIENDAKAIQLQKELETNLNIAFQRNLKKINDLNSFEKLRNELLQKRTKLSNIFGGDAETKYNENLNFFRVNIMKALNIKYKAIFSAFESVKFKRNEKMNSFNSINFQNLDNFNYDPSVMEADYTLNDSEADGFSQLPQETVQVLEQENESLLESYNATIKQVNHLESTILDILQISKQLSSELEIQSSNISNLFNNEEFIESNVIKGNKLLKDGMRSNKQIVAIYVWGFIIAGIVLMLLDYMI